MLVFLLFIIALFINIPIALALGVASLVYILITGAMPMTMIVQSFFSALDSTPLLALPFFVLAGDVMMFGGISRRLVNGCMSVIKGIPGALGCVAVLGCMVFAAISGSGPATAAAIGGILMPAMAKDGYDNNFSASMIAAAGALGPVIPPSLSFIMYGVVAQQSITTLFTAGIVPGVLMGLALMIYTIYCAKRYGFGGKSDWHAEKPKSWRDSAFWAVMVPVIILGGIYGGVFTPTEAAIIAVDYALIVSLFIYKEIKIKDLYNAFKPTCMTIGAISIICCGATAFGRLLTLEQIPSMLANFILSLTDSKVLILLLVNVFLLIVGMFMETLSAIIIVTPILLPMMTMLGINPIHFGVIMVVNLVIGMCTPPVGVNLFVTMRLGGCTLGGMSKWLITAIAVLIVVLLLVTYVPQISLFLVNILA